MTIRPLLLGIVVLSTLSRYENLLGASSRSDLQSCSSSQLKSVSARAENALVAQNNIFLTVGEIYKRCDNSKGDASYAVGYKFYLGLGLEKTNLPAAFSEFLKSAKLGNPSALAMLNNMLIQGKATAKDFIAEIGWLIACSDQNNVCARDILTKLLMMQVPEQERAVIQKHLAEKPMSREFLKACAKQKDPYACFILKNLPLPGSSQLQQGTVTVEVLKKMSKGSADAALQLAELLYKGNKDVAQDLPQAFQYAQRAAHMKSAPALFMVSKMYARGEGVKVDVKESFEAMKASAELNFPAACYEFGAMLGNGVIAKSNIAEAYTWIKKAAMLGNGDALAMLGELAQYGMNEQGKMVPPDFEKAYAFYQKAAAKNNVHGMYYLAQFYRFGLVGERNETAAQKLFDKILQDDSGNSLLFKGFMYEAGSGVPRSLKQAKQCYELCAKNRTDARAKECLERVSKRLKEQHEERAKLERQKQLALKAAQQQRANTQPVSETTLQESAVQESAVQEDIAGEALKKALQGAILYDDQSFVSDVDVESLGCESKESQQESKAAKAKVAVTRKVKSMRITIGNPTDHSTIIIDVLKRVITDRALSKLKKFVYDQNGVQKWFGNTATLQREFSKEDIERHRFAERVDEVVQLYGQKAWFLKDDGTIVKNSVIPGVMNTGDGRKLEGTFEYAYYEGSNGPVVYHRFFHPHSRAELRAKS